MGKEIEVGGSLYTVSRWDEEFGHVVCAKEKGGGPSEVYLTARQLELISVRERVGCFHHIPLLSTCATPKL